MIENGNTGGSENKKRHLHPNRNFLSDSGQETPSFSEKPTSKLPLELPGTKDFSEKKPLSPMEIHETSRNAAHALVDEIMQDGNPKDVINIEDSAMHKAISDLASAEIAHDNIKGALALGDKLIELAGNPGEAVARIYFNAGKNGELEGFEKLKPLLTKEREESTRMLEQVTIGSPLYRPHSSKLTAVVEQCAKDGLPANGWIDAYAIDPRHADELRLEYASKAKRTKNGEVDFGKQYRDEVTNKFLTGNGMTPEVAIQTARDLFTAQETKESKQQIFERFQTLVYENPTHVDTLLEFSKTTLTFNNPKDLTPDQVNWMAEKVTECKKALKEKGVDPFVISRDTALIDLSIADYSGTKPTELVAKINDIAAYQLRFDMPENQSDLSDVARNKKLVENCRDGYLNHFAQKYANEGDFEGANVFLTDIANADRKTFAIKHCLEKTQTKKDVAAIIPDDLTMAFDESFQTLFTVHATIKEGDIEKIKQLTTTLAEKPIDKRDFHTIDRIKDCLQAVFDANHDAGENFTSTISQTLQAINKNPYFSNDIAYMQIDHGDPEGLRTLLTLAEQEKNATFRLKGYAHLTKLAYEFAERN